MDLCTFRGQVGAVHAAPRVARAAAVVVAAVPGEDVHDLLARETQRVHRPLAVVHPAPRRLRHPRVGHAAGAVVHAPELVHYLEGGLSQCSHAP